MDPKLTPLALDASGKIAPTNGNGAPSGPPVTSVPSRVDDGALDSAVDTWAAEHPGEFDPAAEPAAPVLPIPLDTENVDEVPATEEESAPTEEAAAPETIAPTTEAPAAEKPATEEKPAEAPAATVEKPAAEVAPAKPSYAPDEKFALGEGAEWTRGQIVDALRERVALQPKAAESDAFHEIFHVDATRAKETWGPIVARLAVEPQTTRFLDEYLTKPDKAAYLDACAAHFDSTVPATETTVAAIVQRPADDPMVREVAELRQWREQAQQREANEAFNRDMATATAKYPFLATDKGLMSDLLLTSQALYQQESAAARAENRAEQPRPFLLDALELKASIYDALLVARAAQENAAPAAAIVPATLGSPGASPAATRTPKPKVFKGDLNDAVDDWEANKPPEFR